MIQQIISVKAFLTGSIKYILLRDLSADKINNFAKGCSSSNLNSGTP